MTVELQDEYYLSSMMPDEEDLLATTRLVAGCPR
jgi:hypothetical protein